MDRQGGLAPESWINDLKSAWNNVTVDLLHTSLEELLSYATGTLPSVDTIRALFCQSLLYRTNSKARTGLTNGTYKRSWEASSEILLGLHKLLDSFTMNAQEELIIRHLYNEYNAKALATENMLAFVGHIYRMFKDGDRNEGFRMLCEMLQKSKKHMIPLLMDKMKVLLSGRYKDVAVIGRGNGWLPQSENKTRFIEMMGEDEYLTAELVVRGNYQLHIYRDSDIPNRYFIRKLKKF
jgi:hypothetical protein